jgi:hypothetical protein
MMNFSFGQIYNLRRARNSILTGAQPYGASFAKVIVTESAPVFFICHYYFSRARAIKTFHPSPSFSLYVWARSPTFLYPFSERPGKNTQRAQKKKLPE